MGYCLGDRRILILRQRFCQLGYHGSTIISQATIFFGGQISFRNADRQKWCSFWCFLILNPKKTLPPLLLPLPHCTRPRSLCTINNDEYEGSTKKIIAVSSPWDRYLVHFILRYWCKGVDQEHRFNERDVEPKWYSYRHRHEKKTKACNEYSKRGWR